MATPYQDRPLDPPRANPEDRPYFEAAAKGALLVKRCMDCDRPFHYPRAHCPFCLGARTEWASSRGTGTIYSFSITRRSGPIPYAIAYVTLDEGPSMMTNIVECDLDAIECGQRVTVVFKPTNGGPPIPMFKPDSEAPV